MTQRLSITEKVGFSLGDTAGNFVYQSVLLLLAFFYTDVYGLSAATVASIFLFVRVLDGVTDPLMGALADRTETRWGKYRPYLLFLCVPYALASVFVFTVPDFSPMGKIIYAYISYAVLMMLFTATNIPYFGLGSVMTADPKERVTLNSFRFVAATGGGLIITLSVIPLADWLGDGDPAVGYQRAMMVMAAISVILFLITFASTKERIKPVNSGAKSIWNDLKQVWANDQWRWLGGAILALVTAQTIKATSAIYYLSYYVDDAKHLVPLFLSLWMVGGIFGSALAKPLSSKVGTKVGFTALCFVSAFMSAATYLIASDMLIAVMVMQFFVGFFNQMKAPLITSTMADVTDYGELKNNRRLDALIASFTVSILKFGLAIGGALATFLLAVYGYQSGGVEQSAETVAGILLVFTLVPSVGFIVAGLCIHQMKLNATTVENNAEQLSKLRASHAPPTGA